MLVFLYVNVYPFFSPRPAMNNQPYLFVHSRDQNSLKILETLKQLNKDSLCRIVDIVGKQRNELPAFLKSVPTLYVPETKDVYVGKDIYSYIAKPVTARREVPTTTPSQAPPAAAAGGGYQAWSFSGTKSLTESYSSWESPGKFSTDDQLQYSFLSGPVATPANPEPQTKQSFDGNKAGRNDDITARMEAMKKARESEFKGISRQ
jgi:hypothetical protein